ncbi:MAG: hypothetical protein SP1CHLAM54_12180 [Chlamydiia bacterium]|nr:hypothetical protein [Chlamydiia bacterium]MCH9616116.1 hypothetical protein [Chlamydiia bacterium]MCH9629461.1 hypothetical protein [Chlamydiia bacterium]
MAVSRIDTNTQVFVNNTDFYGTQNVTQQIADFACTLFRTIVFPIGLLNYFVAHNVLQAQDLNVAPERLNQARETLPGERITLQTPDGIQLDGMVNRRPGSNKWIVFCNPNCALYEGVAERYERIANIAGANYVVFNYRGTGASEGSTSCPRDLYVDGETALRYALDQPGSSPEHTMMYGWSLGGAVAAETAANHPGVHLCSDRSFESLSHFVATRIASFAATLLHLIGWEMNALDALRRISGETMIIAAQNDEVIGLDVSLYEGAVREGIAVPRARVFNGFGHGGDHVDTARGFLRDNINAFL